MEPRINANVREEERTKDIFAFISVNSRPFAVPCRAWNVRQIGKNKNRAEPLHKFLSTL